jgi:tryptophan synthase alpha chain
MSLISETLERLADRNEGALVAYVTGGDPSVDLTNRIVLGLADGGADIVEIGIPFSDPIADGPTIQAAANRALKAKTNPAGILSLVGEVKRKRTVPVVLLTYYNPVYRMGLENFFESAARFGVDGVIVPDLPIEESLEYRKVADAHGVDTVFLAAPSTSDERLRRIASQSSGFLYLASLFGVTGTRRHLDKNLPRLVRRTRRLADKLPVCVGFGISTPNHVATVLRAGANGAIVGSALVEIVARNSNRKDLLRLVTRSIRKLKAATHQS